MVAMDRRVVKKVLEQKVSASLWKRRDAKWYASSSNTRSLNSSEIRYLYEKSHSTEVNAQRNAGVQRPNMSSALVNGGDVPSAG